jgi:hypothetical protein
MDSDGHPESEPQPLWTTKQVAELLALSPRTLIAWRQRGYGPAWIEVVPGERSTIRYNPAAVREWLAERTTPAAPPEKVSA